MKNILLATLALVASGFAQAPTPVPKPKPPPPPGVTEVHGKVVKAILS